jgi:hypothetical protein
MTETASAPTSAGQQGAPLFTRWGLALDRRAPLPEYPRPQLVRDRWQNLNGPWQYAIRPLAVDGGDPVAVDDPAHPPASWDGPIVVPFSPETPLSEVRRTVLPGQTLWYHRNVDVMSPPREDERLLLHFGAVDQSCRVAVRGIEVGGHSGGYLPFTLDITEAAAGRSSVDIVVAVRDVTDTSWLARGKQSSRPRGIWYTPQSGIWQTVWLETVPRVAVDRLVLTPQLDEGAVEVTVVSNHAGPTAIATATISSDGAVAAEALLAMGATTTVALSRPIRPWCPDDPHLYDVTVCLGEDVVTSYVGMRSVGVGPDANDRPRLLLNGRPHLPIGLLDQGYWPDGGYTAPSDAALEYDITLAKDFGYTLLRKHIKVEPARWYYHCDRLGMLVWQDAVSGGTTYQPVAVAPPAAGAPPISDRRHRLFGRANAAGRAAFEAELSEMIEHLRGFASISMWVPFNEGWGQFDAARIAALVHRLDPTRPVDHASGWHDQGGGDVLSLHIYGRPVRLPALRGRREARPIALTEYGGYSLAVPGHTIGDRQFGYRQFRDRAAFGRALVRLHLRQIAPLLERGLSALVYTQLSDVEDEVNGLVTYDRDVVKVDAAAIRQMNSALQNAAGRAMSSEQVATVQEHSGSIRHAPPAGHARTENAPHRW